MTSPTATSTGQKPKPLPALAAWLASQHQQEQQSIADEAAVGLALLWRILDFQNIDKSAPAWLHAVTLQAQEKFRESEQSSYLFVQGSKWAVEPFAEPQEKIDTVFPLKEFQLAMQATGPATVKRATQRLFAPPQIDPGALLLPSEVDVPKPDIASVESEVMALGKLTSTGAAVKQILNGGRGEVQALVEADALKRAREDKLIGWARFTEDSKNGPCYFCAMLASRGAVYLSGKSFSRSSNMIREPIKNPRGNNRTTRRSFLGDGVAKVHDHCKCTLRPVYREQDAMDARAKYFERQWKGMYKDAPWLSSLEGTEDMKQFRRVYRRPPPYSDRPAVALKDVRRNRELVAAEFGARSEQALWWDRQIKALEAAS